MSDWHRHWATLVPAEHRDTAETRCTWCDRRGIGVCDSADRAVLCQQRQAAEALADTQRRLTVAVAALRSVARRPGLPARLKHDVSEIILNVTAP